MRLVYLMYGERLISWLPRVCRHEFSSLLRLSERSRWTQVSSPYHVPFVSYKYSGVLKRPGNRHYNEPYLYAICECCLELKAHKHITAYFVSTTLLQGIPRYAPTLASIQHVCIHSRLINVFK